MNNNYLNSNLRSPSGAHSSHLQPGQCDRGWRGLCHVAPRPPFGEQFADEPDLRPLALEAVVHADLGLEAGVREDEIGAEGVDQDDRQGAYLARAPTKRRLRLENGFRKAYRQGLGLLIITEWSVAKKRKRI